MYNRLPLILLILSTACLFTSCEGGTTFTKTLDNQSQDTLYIKLITVYNEGETDTVAPGSSRMIFWDDQMGFFVDDTYTCTQLLDTALVSVSGGKVLVKDIMDPANWTRESKSGRNSREDCTFTISDGDLQ